MLSHSSQLCSLWIESARVIRLDQCRCPGRLISTGLGVSSEIRKTNLNGKSYTLDPVEMEPVFGVNRASDFSEKGGLCSTNETNEKNVLLSSGDIVSRNQKEVDKVERVALVAEKEHEEEEPLARNLHNTIGPTPYRVSWYDYGSVSPSKRFTYWAYRRLKELPTDWQEYYRRMLYQEISAARYVNQTWDCFMMVVDGYRKAKWVLKKYGIPIDESLIPKPYNNFWEETTHEERVWAHRRSHQMKELQALYRDEDELVFGAHTMDRREVSYGSIKNVQTGMQGGTPVHALDLPAPCESEIKTSPQIEDMSSALMSSIEDDKLWNPVLRSRIHTRRSREEVELYSFEDDEEDENSPS
ncbi:hypothetical protein TCDM_07616 [Trypanosoma cruzi Dm28c]|uniref:Uncharacterized protein n=2 Tax=Trypanosoma cruzi TaxID=5693 RepID=V5BIQ3_TRYCR|nr:hypothetical protein TCDM_07616 [Trypanosoma cruzi Dm28c]PBJ69433.1 hypothetical protein BCY84_19839 [Trypanosoma cruzi cruzi]PWU86129.1 hypothetical protein C4B63_132g67 [Trypanosoma cruzi]